MTENVAGRVVNVKLSKATPLLPLHEAIVNSLEAIEEANRSDGSIQIRVHRAHALGPDDDSSPRPVDGFEIVDNGVGFTDENFSAFLTADTDRKRARGGRGVGRFLWLKAFERVTVRSTYMMDQHAHRREFAFECVPDGVVEHTVTEVDASDSTTAVRLLGMRQPYSEQCPTHLTVIAQHILEHCLARLHSDRCPALAISDGDSTVDVRALFKDTVEREAVIRTASVKGHDIQLVFYKLRSSRTGKHQLRFCADGREVGADDLGEMIPDLPNSLDDEMGKRFTYAVYVSGKLLDSLVAADRSGFRFSSDGELGLFEVTEEDLRKAVLGEVEAVLLPYVEPLRKRKVEEITEYVREHAPRFRHVVRHHPDLIARIPAALPPHRLEAELARADFEVNQAVRKMREELERGQSTDPVEYQTRLAAFIHTYDEIGKSKLADYIAHRKTVLSLITQALEKNTDGTYQAESIVHSLIFPMKTTSDEVAAEDQNLWVIDERLSFHRYLASDLQLRQMEPLETPDQARPDLAIFSNPIAYTEGDYPYETVVIVEFKKPERVEYTNSANPIGQVLDYVQKIREGRAKDAAGHSIPHNEHRQYYCYVIVDVTPKLREVLAFHDLIETPDGQGFFKYHSKYNAYCEVLPYGKLLRDAEKRNKVLFDKLNI